MSEQPLLDAPLSESPDGMFGGDLALQARLPYFDQAPRHLAPMEADPSYQAAVQELQPMQAELGGLRDRVAFLDSQLRIDPETGDYPAGRNYRSYYDERETAREQLAGLHTQYRQAFDPRVRPMLEGRLSQAASLPIYRYWRDAETYLATGPSVPLDDRVQYGLCAVDTDRIVAADSGPVFDWSGGTNSKAGEGESSDLIVERALDMLAGDFDPLHSLRPVRLKAARTGDGGCVYFLEDGSHRVAAAKLIGRPTVVADVESYNYRADTQDPAAQAIDADQRSRSLPVAAGAPL